MGDMFDEPTSGFVRVEDLEGRSVVVFPEKVAEAKGDNGPYNYLQGDVIVLNGATTDLMASIPAVVTNMRFTSQPIVGNGERKLKQGDGRPFAGRINAQPGKFGRKAYGIEALPADMRELANREAERYMSERKAAQATSASEFDI